MISFVLFPQASLPSLNFNTTYMCIEIGQLLSSAEHNIVSVACYLALNLF